jgi:glutaredoxin
MKPDVLLYTTSWCPYCHRAKALLKQKGVKWNEIDIESDPDNRQAMRKLVETLCHRSSSTARMSAAPTSSLRSMLKVDLTNCLRERRLQAERARPGLWISGTK